MEVKLRDYPKNPNDNFDMEIKIHDGWFPLLRVPYLIDPKNPYFDVDQRINGRVYNKIHLHSSGYAFKYKAGRRGVVSIYSGYFSSMGVAGNTTRLQSSVYGLRQYKVYGEPDIFCLGVVRPNNLPVVTSPQNGNRRYSYRDYHDVTVKSEDVTILVSTEKLRKAKFQRERYTGTIRNEILFKILKLQLDYKVQIVDVSEDYLNNFYSIPEGITSNSIVDTIQMEDTIKTQVFSNLNSIVA